MLTFILLVVLGGGLGLLAVSLAESPKPATDGGRTTRAADAAGGLDAALDEATDDTGHTVEDRVTTPVEPAPEQDMPSRHDELALVRSVAPSGPPVAAPRRRPDPRSVPPAYTAVEGRYDTVAVSPLWRRMLSLCTVVIIAVVIGVGVAGLAAAVFGALAELLNAAVG